MNSKKIKWPLWVLLMLALHAGGQYMERVNAGSSEKVYIQCNQTVIEAGDTLWWKAYVICGKHFSTNSTNLYMELFTSAGKLMDHGLFPVLSGQAIGQLALPDSLPSGIYWLRFFTLFQQRLGITDLTIIPVTVFHEDDKMLALFKEKASQQIPTDTTAVSVLTDTLDNGPFGLNSWRIMLKDTGDYFYSCLIVDADLPAGEKVWCVSSLAETLNDRVVAVPDTSFLQYSGSVFKANGKTPIKDKPLYVMLIKGSSILTQGAISVDGNGRFVLDHLFFTGQADLAYQLNNNGMNSKNVNLAFDPYVSPAFHIPQALIKRDSILLPKQMIDQRIVNQYAPGRLKGIKLKEVKIKSWRSPRKGLDSAYTTGVYSEPALYAFDLRNDKYYPTLGIYLTIHLGTQGGNSSFDTPTFPRHPLLFYVNEELKTWDEISDLNLADVAYIKAMESDFIGYDPFTKFKTGVGGFTLNGSGGLKLPNQPTPMVVMIYTRKGKDIKPLPGLNSIAITGYSPILRFRPSTGKRVTLSWQPLLSDDSVKVRFTNNGTAKHFRLTIMGFNHDGRPLYYTKLMSGSTMNYPSKTDKVSNE
jgi:hypothetical protein